MDGNSICNLYKKEREILENYRKMKPELFIFPKISEKEIFSSIGIQLHFPPRPKGYFRLSPQDFIVEEISTDGEISKIEIKENKISIPSPPFTLYTNLIKVRVSTSEAIFNLARYLGIKPDKIGYGGLKDINAITSQKIAFPNIDSEILEKIKKFSHSNFFLSDFSFGKGSIAPGQILGNRFSIFIRTEKEINEIDFSEILEKIEKEGFLNFYQVQRFGTPRFLSHLLGKLILQGKYKEAIFNFLFNRGLKGTPFFQEIREAGERLSSDWEKIEKIWQEFPYTFRNELRLISYLKENPRNFIGALIFFKDQTTLWVYAYTSYLFNLLLSLNEKIELPEEIPLLLSDDSKDWKIYDFWIKKNGIESFQNAISPFRFIIPKRRFVKTRIYPKSILFEILPEGVILSFVLEKGAYATTFLMNIFEIETGEPIPEWVNTAEFDIKKELKIGSIEKVKEILGQDIFILQKQKIEDIDL